MCDSIPARRASEGALACASGWYDRWGIMALQLPASWRPIVGAELKKPYFQELEAFLAEERATHKVFPPEEDVFNALKATPFDKVKVLLLGQDPYHGDGQA